MFLPGTIGHDQIVSINVIGLLAHAFEYASFVNGLELDARLVLFVDRLDFNLPRTRRKRADNHARAITKRMHSQKRVRRTVPDLSQTLQFPVRQNHARTMPHLTETPTSKIQLQIRRLLL